MIKLEIIDIENYLYKIKDEENIIYTLNIEFLDLMKKLQVGDCIYLSSELLNKNYEGYSTSYTFGDLNSQYGKKDIQLTDADVIKLEMRDSETYLKRLYG
jgi:hypothetical protein